MLPMFCLKFTFTFKRQRWPSAHTLPHTTPRSFPLQHRWCRRPSATNPRPNRWDHTCHPTPWQKTQHLNKWKWWLELNGCCIKILFPSFKHLSKQEDPRGVSALLQQTLCQGPTTDASHGKRMQPWNAYSIWFQHVSTKRLRCSIKSASSIMRAPCLEFFTMVSAHIPWSVTAVRKQLSLEELSRIKTCQSLPKHVSRTHKGWW